MPGALVHPWKCWALACGLTTWLSTLPAAFGQASAVIDPPPRTNAWGLAVNLRQLAWNSQEYPDRHLAAWSPAIQISRIWIHKSSWTTVDMRLMLGPNSQRFVDSPSLDYTGTGLGASWAFALGHETLRDEPHNWGLFLTASADEWRGRSFRSQQLQDGKISDNWVLKLLSSSVTPGLFYSFMQKARPRGHRPEWMVTRIEGYTLQLGLSVPLNTRLDLTATKGNAELKENIRLSGYSLFFSFAAWLGI